MTKAYAQASTARNVTSPGQAAEFAWRMLIITAGYTLTSLIGGLIVGRTFEVGALGTSVLSGILAGATLGPLTRQIRASWLSLSIVGASILFLNTLSVAIEGSFFAPSLSPMARAPLAWTAYLLLQSAVTAGLVAVLFGQAAASTTQAGPRNRTWLSWLWRFVASSFSYLLFYFIFGAANYALVTKPYYAAHVSGLAVPPVGTVLLAETVRAPLIVLSVAPLILLWNGKKTVLALWCGTLLFVIGGLIPLLLNTALPDILRIASAVEIFFQNFLTGAVAAALLGRAQVSGSVPDLSS